MADAVVVTDETGKVTFINRAGEKLLGQKMSDLGSGHILEHFRDEDGGMVSWMGRKIFHLESMHNERTVVVRPDGSQVPVLLSLFPLTDEGKLIRAVGIMRDQTEVEKRNHELETANKKLAEANKRLEEIARTDEMTGLLNRRAFLERLNDYMAAARRYNEPLAIVYIDPNKFKPVNDTYGHAQGDRVIREVAHRFRHALYETDIVARYGGDEFVAILPRTGGANIEKPLRKIWKELCFSLDLEHPDTKRSNGVRITVAIGAAVRMGSRIPSVEEFISLAEKKMYQSKDRRSRFEVDIQAGF